MCVAWLARALGPLASHTNRTGSVLLGQWWKVLLGAVTPLALALVLVLVLVRELAADVGAAYEGYPAQMRCGYG